MHRKRTIALLTLLLLNVFASVLLRVTGLTSEEIIASETAVVSETIPTEPITEAPEDNVVIKPAPVTIEETVIVNPPTPITGTKNCYVGGCSSQICSDRPDMVSTCEWRESYACYQSATCERQSSGECGWTVTPALNACLVQANSNTIDE